MGALSACSGVTGGNYFTGQGGNCGLTAGGKW